MVQRFIAIIIVLGLIAGLSFFLTDKREGDDGSVQNNIFTIRGDSLKGRFEPGDKVIADFDYYEKREIARGDVVLYDYAGNRAPLIKIVRAIPGDTFLLKSSEGGEKLVVNGEVVLTDLGEPYLFTGNSVNLLSQYIRDYRSVVPRNSYLIFGNLSRGSLDSSRFGLVSRNDILGKIVR